MCVLTKKKGNEDEKRNEKGRGVIWLVDGFDGQKSGTSGDTGNYYTLGNYELVRQVWKKALPVQKPGWKPGRVEMGGAVDRGERERQFDTVQLVLCCSRAVWCAGGGARTNTAG